MGTLDPFVAWLWEEVQGIENVLKKIAPNVRHIGKDVVTYQLPPGVGAPGVQRAANDPAASREWASLPPLAGAVGKAPLIAPAAPFKAELAGASAPPPILAPLSHGRSLEAPKGLVSGVARPVEAARGKELPRAVQRAPLRARQHGPADEAWADASDPEPEPPATATAVSANSAATSAPIASAPARRLDVAATAARPLGRELTRAPEPSPVKALGLVGQPRAARPAGGPRATEPAAPKIQRAPAAPSQPAQPDAPSAVPSPRPVPDAPRLTIGQARRLGLGTPIAGGPLPASAAGTAQPLHSNLPATRTSVAPEAPAMVQRAPDGPPELPLAAHPAAAAATPPPGLPTSATAGPALAEAPLMHSPVAARWAAAPVSSSRSAQTPIVSAQPLRARVQRAPLTLPARSQEGPAGATGSTTVVPDSAGGFGAAPVKVRRDGDAAHLSKALDARSFTHGGEIYLPSSHGPITSGKGRSLLAHELTHVTQQRRLGSSLPEEHTPHGKALEAEAVAAERGADMPLAQPIGATEPKRDADTTAAAPDLSPAPHAHATAASAATATGPAQRAPAQGGAGAGNGSARETRSEQELEDLANQLYSRIGRQLRRELLVDRERAGLAMDFR